MNRLVYEMEPEPEIEFDEIEDDDDGEAPDNPYEGYSTYEVSIAETMIKAVRVFAPDADKAKEYITDFVGLDNIEMTDIEEYKKLVVSVVDAPGEEPDYTYPLIREDDEE